MSDDDAPVLFDVPELQEGAAKAGPAEAGLRHAIAAADKPDRDGALSELAAGLIGAAIVGARALDAAERRVRTDLKAGYLVAALLTPFREVCQAAGLPIPNDAATDPASTGAGIPDWGNVLGPS